MKKPNALIFGHLGGIGLSTKAAFLQAGYRIIPVDRSIIDFNKSNSDQQIVSLLNNSKPEVVVNCAGVFENGYQVSHYKTMNVNFGSNWSIIKYYMANPDNKTRVIMIGSSCYNSGRKLYPLYSASKAALYNLWESARDALANTMVQVDLLNPVRTLTPMSTAGKKIDPDLQYLKPEQVAEEILKLVKENLPSRCIDMTFEDKK